MSTVSGARFEQLQCCTEAGSHVAGNTMENYFSLFIRLSNQSNNNFLQIYSSRKIKHPSFRKRASSGTMPYYIPFRHRQRTKSENADATNSQQSQDSSMDCENTNEKNLASMDMDNAPLLHVSSNPQFNKIKLSQLKKSKSMESLLPPKADDKESKVNSSSSTLEFVSHRIQKLKFNEWSALCCVTMSTISVY